MEPLVAAEATRPKQLLADDSTSDIKARSRPPGPAAPANAPEALQCSRCGKWLQPGAKYRNKRLKLCSSCYVNHHNHASQDAKKKYDRSRKRAMMERRSSDVGGKHSSKDYTEDDSPTESAAPTPRFFPAPFPLSQPHPPPHFTIPVPVQPRAGFRPPVSPGHTMLGGGDINQLGNPRSPSLLPFDIPLSIRTGRIGSAPGTPTAIPLMEINQLSQGRIGSPGQPGTPTMSSSISCAFSLFTFPSVNPLTVSLSPLLPSAILSEPQAAKDIDLQVSGMAGRVMSFDQQTEGVINAVASLIGMQEPDPIVDETKLQYLETDIRKLYALENEWKKCAVFSPFSVLPPCCAFTEYNGTVASAKKLLEQLQAAQGPESPLFAYIASRLGSLEFRAGNFNNGAKLFITAIIHNEKVHRKMEVLADTQKAGIAYGGANFVDEERSFHELAIRLGKALLPIGLQPRESPPSHAMLLERSAVFHHNCTIYYFRTKRYDLAEESNQETLRLLRVLPQVPTRNTQRAAALHERALLLAQRNEYAQAVTHIEECLKLSREAYGENHPRLAESLTCHGILLYLTDKLDLAQSYLYKALKMKMQLHAGESHPSILATLQALGLISLRDPTQAVCDPMRIFEHRPILADVADQERDE